MGFDGPISVARLINSAVKYDAETDLAPVALVTTAPVVLLARPGLPVQNMDELTSATVARGVAKVAALLPEGWQLILMFHGDEALETFRREVPASVYYLPWLGPASASHAGTQGVRTEASRIRPTTPRPLENVVERRDRA